MKNILYTFLFIFLAFCSKKEKEKLNTASNAIKPSNVSTINAAQPSQVVKQEENKTVHLTPATESHTIPAQNSIIDEKNVIYKLPIFIEIEKDALIKNGIDIRQEWKDFIKNNKPFGIILNKYHFLNKRQAKELIKTLKIIGGKDMIIATDREGGRIDKMFWGNFEEWKSYPSPEDFGTLYEQTVKISKLPDENPIKKADKPNISKLKEDFEKIYNKMFKEMKEIGIDMTFAPSCDVRSKSSNKFTIGSRSFSENPNTVSILSKIFIKSALKNKILVSPKHAPGIGSVKKDTQFEFGVINKKKEKLEIRDLKPFIDIFKKYSKEIDFVLCPHILYKDIDSQNVSTKSTKFVDYIREKTKEDILIISDDISMEAFNFEKKEKTLENQIESMTTDIIITGTGKSLPELKQIAQVIKKKDNTRFFKYLIKRANPIKN